MSSSLMLLFVFIGEILPAAIFLYGAYWTFTIRRALAIPAYRSHAMWLGFISILAALTTPITYTNNPTISLFITIFYAAFAAFMLAWIDATITIVRRSDPRLRSILRWESLRYVVWAIFVLAIVLLSYSIVSQNFSPTSNAVGFATGLVIIIPFITGAPTLLTGARRSRDPILRGSLKWIGLCLLSVLGGSIVSAVVKSFGVSLYDQFYSIYAFPVDLVIILAAYCLYRSTRSLAPINRLSLEAR